MHQMCLSTSSLSRRDMRFNKNALPKDAVGPHTREALRDATFACLLLLQKAATYGCNSPRCIFASSLTQ